MDRQFLEPETDVITYGQDATTMEAGFIPIFGLQVQQNLVEALVSTDKGLEQCCFLHPLAEIDGALGCGRGAAFARMEWRLAWRRVAVAGPRSGDGFTPRLGALRDVCNHIAYRPPGARTGPGPLLGPEACQKSLELGCLSTDQRNHFGHG